MGDALTTQNREKNNTESKRKKGSMQKTLHRDAMPRRVSITSPRKRSELGCRAEKKKKAAGPELERGSGANLREFTGKKKKSATRKQTDFRGTSAKKKRGQIKT